MKKINRHVNGRSLIIPEDTETNTNNTLLEQSESQEEEEEGQEYEEENNVYRNLEESEIRLQDIINEENSEICRGRGRPKLLKTGQSGRPRKIYQKGNTKTPDPETVSDALTGNNSEA